MMKWLRHVTLNFLTRHLLKAVTVEDVLLISGKDWLINKRKLSREEITSLKEEASSFIESTLWKLIVRDLKYHMTLQRFDKATTSDDMMYGKAMADCIAKIELYVSNLRKL